MRRPLLIGLIAGALVFVALVVVGVLVTLSLIDRQNADADHRSATTHLTNAVETSEAAVAEADQVLSLATDPLLAGDALTAVATERDAATGSLAEAQSLLGTDPEPLDTEQLRDLTADLRAAAREVGDDVDPVVAALDELVTVTQAAAPAVEAANFDAENAPHIAFRTAVADLGSVPDDAVAEYLVSYLDAAHALEASHAEEIAEKAGPLLDRRLVVQAFARSLAGGVLLDFDWAMTVNGYGTGGSYGGTSYWSSADGGSATITLSDSVATMWPAAGVQSLVAHEVGHAVLARTDCNALFFDSEYAAGGEEPWATAWAIGLGYTAEGNGESIYGRPADGLIQLTTQCR
ncbi:hypothetical protein [Pseudolysinimonas yzui]|uniref:Uncharacterized protein n=1 Tax=Pseudolysinimonas yzui TaxID=2708254 RepID=A0A8J3GQM7_9MICO|nr:hypothetical protein [Pseudolysinimonas yzui]GHF16839.1 hypothetical protein GCM10011600_16980 [Pseudolysinimonas yzui]